MPQLFPPEIIENTVECYHTQISTKSKIIYSVILIIVLFVFVSLPLVYVEISSQSRGVIRSPYENTNIQSAIYGEIVSYRMQENKMVKKGDTLIILNSEKLDEQIALAKNKVHENEFFISDLSCLLTGKYNQLLTPKYRGEFFRYRAKINELEISVNYLRKELITQKTLADQKVISNFDYLESKNNYDKASEQLYVSKQDYQTNWITEQTTLNRQNAELNSNIRQLEREKSQFVIVAPITGTLVQVAGFQKNNFIAPGQNLAFISSNSSLLAECYISPSDIGYIRKNQTVTFQFDAYNYREWGMIRGKVKEILSDVVLINQKPMFRVRCTLNAGSLQLKSGYTGNIQKGLTFTANFRLNRRSLWQLLFDKIENWLNPKLSLEKQ